MQKEWVHHENLKLEGVKSQLLGVNAYEMDCIWYLNRRNSSFAFQEFEKTGVTFHSKFHPARTTWKHYSYTSMSIRKWTN